MRRPIAFIVAILGLSAWGFAQSLQTTATLSGRIVTTDAPPQPVRRAIVTLTGSEILTNLSAITDDQGRFEFSRLTPGRYAVSASKIAYLTTAYGAKRPGRPGTAVTLTAGQNLRDLAIPLARGAVITGVVRAQNGEPASNVQVTVARAELVTAIRAELASMGQLATDDRGVYRAYGLAPGEYVVSATPSSTSIANVIQLSRNDMDSALAALQQRARGGTPAGLAASAVPALTSGRFGYAPIYYPGTPMAADAMRIRVAAGEERSGVDVPLTLVATSRVDGTVATADGSPVPVVRLAMTPLGPPTPMQLIPRIIRTPGQPNAFAFADLTPGRYLIIARAGTDLPPEGISPIAMSGMLESSTSDAFFAMAEFSLAGQDLGAIDLTLRPLMSLSGRVAFETTMQAGGSDPTKVSVGLASANPAGTGLTLGGGVPIDLGLPRAVSASADGSFRVKSILPGAYIVAATMPHTTGAVSWRLKSAIVNGRDVLDDPIVFDANGGEVTGVVVTFSDRHSEISGRLQTPSGDPASEYVVVIFPAERERWRPGARRIRSTRPASDGRFSVADLPAGDYLIAALTDVEPNEWQDPAFLEQLVPAAFKVTLADGGRVMQDLQIKR